MSEAIQLTQLVLETAAAGCVGSLAGMAFGSDYAQLVARHGTDTLRALHWPMVRRCCSLSLYLGSFLVALFCVGGGAEFDIITTVIGLIVGIVIGRVRESLSGAVRGALLLGLILCGLDYFCELVGDRFSWRLIGYPALGVVIAAAVGTIFLCVWGTTKAVGKESRAWSFRLPVFGSLLLTSGGPLLWLVLASSVGFGWSCSSRYIPISASESWRRNLWLGIASVAIGHTLFTFYFYEMSSYGISWHPVVAVTPYALGGMVMGVFLHRVALHHVPNRVA